MSRYDFLDIASFSIGWNDGATRAIDDLQYSEQVRFATADRTTQTMLDATKPERVSSARTKLRVETNVGVNVLLLALPFAGILVNGYEFGKHDHEHYIPEVMNLADPSYFPNDYLFVDPSGEYTFWLSGMAFLSRWLPLDAICLAAYLLFRYLSCWFIYHISYNLFGCRLSALLASLLLLVSRVVGGTTMSTFEIYFGVRDAALAFSLGSVLFLISDRLVLAALFCGLAFLIHPLIALPLILVLAIRIGALVLRET